MPSTRRVKVLVVCVAFSVVTILWITSSARQASDREFYDRTLAAMDAQAAAAADTASDSGEAARLREISLAAQAANHEGSDSQDGGSGQGRMPPEVVLESSGGDGSDGDKSVAGRVRVKGEGRWDIGEGKEGEQKVEEAPKKTKEEIDVENELNGILKRSPIIIFSKTYCPFSRAAKSVLLDKYAIVPAPFVVELDQHPMGFQLQAALEKSTGRRTVPNILINGRSIGGGDEIQLLDQKGELGGKVQRMGGKRVMEVRVKEREEKSREREGEGGERREGEESERSEGEGEGEGERREN